MTIIAKIDDTNVTMDDLLRYLKIKDQFDQIIENMITERVTVMEAKKKGITAESTEIQEEADRTRRLLRLHRAQETFDYLENLGLSLEQFESNLKETILKRKMMEHVCSDMAVTEYYKLNSPQFDRIEVAHIVLDSEGKAREMLALLEDDPDGFEAMAREYSLASETAQRGGIIGDVMRGALQNEIEARVFNAEVNDVLGPFPSEDGLVYEIIKVISRTESAQDPATEKTIRKLLHDQWIGERIQEHRIELL